MKICWRSPPLYLLGFKGGSNLCHCHVRGLGLGRLRPGFTKMTGPEKGQREMTRLGPLHPFHLAPVSALPLSLLRLGWSRNIHPGFFLGSVSCPGYELGENCVPKIQGFCSRLCDPFGVCVLSQEHKCPCPQKFLEKVAFYWSRRSSGSLLYKRGRYFLKIPIDASLMDFKLHF